MDELPMLRLHGKTQDGRESRRAAGAAGENAITLSVSGDLIEKQRGRLFFFHVELTDGAELEIPIRAPDLLQLTQRFDVAQPGTQVERIARFLAFATQSFVLHRTSYSRASRLKRVMFHVTCARIADCGASNAIFYR